MARPVPRTYTGKDSFGALPSKPVISSRDTDWQGFVLESHNVPPSEIKEHRIGFNLFSMITSRAGVRRHWREGAYDRSLHLYPGFTSIFSPCDLYTNWATEHHSLTALAIQPTLFDRVGDEICAPRAELIPQHGVPDPVLEHMLLALQADLEQGSPTGALFGESLVQSFAAYALRRYGVLEPRTPNYRSGLNRIQLRRVADYIEAHLSENLHVRELAAIANLSSYHFGKMFKLSTGRTVHDYVLDQRVARARRLLREGKLSIAQISSFVGLPNPSHFARVFRERTGTSPGLWRSKSQRPLE